MGLSKHLVLIGLPGSGKSTVGALVAQGLGVELIDIDREIERAEKRSIAEIFQVRGEPWFRTVEARETGRALSTPSPAVIVPGGGWAAQAGNVDSARGRAITVYLEIPPETAVLRAAPGTRPLLGGSDPLARMRALYAQREPAYRQADHRIAVGELPATEIALHVVELARQSLSE